MELNYINLYMYMHIWYYCSLLFVIPVKFDNINYLILLDFFILITNNPFFIFVKNSYLILLYFLKRWSVGVTDELILPIDRFILIFLHSAILHSSAFMLSLKVGKSFPLMWWVPHLRKRHANDCWPNGISVVVLLKIFSYRIDQDQKI